MVTLVHMKHWWEVQKQEQGITSLMESPWNVAVAPDAQFDNDWSTTTAY